MNIGQMDKRVTLKAPVDIADNMGGYDTEWSEGITVWAEIKKPALSTVGDTGTIMAVMTWEIGIRYREDVEREWRVEYGDKVFSVEHTYNLGRREKTVLVCREVIR